MSKCEHWHKRTVQKYDPWRDLWLPCDLYRCMGTKEMEECDCGGDPTKCDFYPEKREETKKPMKTAEMWLAAQQDGKTYQADDDTYYNAQLGFVDSNGCLIDAEDFRYVNDIMNLIWTNIKTISRQEAEEKLGVKIIN